MKILKSIEDVKNFVKPLKKADTIIGFVPTMGALHEGHLELGKNANQNCDILIYSIFVNPIQFGPNEDLDKYPRDLEGDIKKLETIGVDAIFFPSVEIMYPQGFLTEVYVKEMSKVLCGATRSNHFAGVTTVVTKLFNIVEADKAFFGKKDYQQFTILKKMVKDLNMNIELFGVDTVRESDGLAKSSRNMYLNEKERKSAVLLSKALFYVRDHVSEFSNSSHMLEVAKSIIESDGSFKIEYLDLRECETLKEISDFKPRMVLLVAARIGTTRLIDNIEIEMD
ncbi:MAG: pantoate--beta-alanine ligase [Candidatus Delongbacteria bacterium]|nr:pantoate--beta-alanine ligase [Candidatus Delongbacteria bacterium]MBN2836194.1 pantoate--beta-alanine ligase [Candidatus Delongbacteria bacterium]